MNPQAERRVGSIIGAKWRVDGLLGSGSMAAVYAVTHRNGARAALKILHPTLCTDPSVCERFLGEGYLANSVKHSGVVRVLDDGITDDGCVFLVMDLLEGETLEGLRQRRGGRIPVVEALDLADRLLDVLAAVHTAGIIHRDLKPQNVFVCHDGQVKLLDFGVARVFDRTSQSKLSMFGLVLGTPSFMAPEQAVGSRDAVDHRSDIWSAGATIFTSLTGETVHLGANVQAKLLAAATMKARSIAMVMPELPQSVANVIDMSLRFTKEERWQSADAMRRGLREVREAAGLGRPEPTADEVERAIPSALPPSLAASAPKSLRPPRPEVTSHGPDGTFIGVGTEEAHLRHVVGGHGPAPSRRPPPLPPRVGPSRGPQPPLASVPPSLPPAVIPSTSVVPPSIPKPASTAVVPSIPKPASTSVVPSKPPSLVPSSGSLGPTSLPGSSQPFGPPPISVVPRSTVKSSRPPASTIPYEAAPPPSFPSRAPTTSPIAMATPQRRVDARGSGAGEGSIPAYGSTLKTSVDSLADIDVRAFGVRRRGGVAVWIAAVLLAASALGGIGFVATKRGSLGGPLINETLPTVTPPASPYDDPVAPITPVNAPTIAEAPAPRASSPTTPMVEVAPAPLPNGSVSASAAPTSPPPPPPRAWRAPARRWTPLTQPRVQPTPTEPTPAPTPDPRPAPTNDPFGTPE